MKVKVLNNHDCPKPHIPTYEKEYTRTIYVRKKWYHLITSEVEQPYTRTYLTHSNGYYTCECGSKWMWSTRWDEDGNAHPSWFCQYRPTEFKELDVEG